MACASSTSKRTHEQRVGAISEADARAEGFPSCEAFLAMWRIIHGKDADLNDAVWVFEFELAP